MNPELARLTDTLVYHDGPVVFIAKAGEDKMIGVAISDSEVFLTRVADDSLKRFLRHELDLRTLMSEPPTPGWFRGEWVSSWIHLTQLGDDLAKVDGALLPQPGFLLPSPHEQALARQPRLSDYQVIRLRQFLVGYMKDRFVFHEECPYDSYVVGIADAFSESLPDFPHSVPDWPTERAAQQAMFKESIRALELT